jgi:4-alpha-glucanotransferase
MSFPRASGVLLHPTSLPGRFGVGDLGHESYKFIDFLTDSKQQLWQVLPLGPTGFGNSPYMCYSAMAGNPLLISPERLRDEGLLTQDDLARVQAFPVETVEFEPVQQAKVGLLRKACEAFKRDASTAQRQSFQAFCTAKASWLDDYALFMSLKEAFNGASWYTWTAEIAHRDLAVLQQWQMKLASEIDYHKFLQFEFFRQWSALRHYANQKGIQIIGDIPIYVAHDSADVWAHPENYCLDADGEPDFVAGVPPDYFSATGQLWGNPVYNWDYLQQTGFQWWVERFESLLDYVDWIRIDHFRGFESYWAVPKAEETAINGEWMEAPGTAFFEQLKQKLGKLPILAEDLGVITPEVEALRDRFEFPGMKILQFAFGSGPGNPYLPFNYPRNCLVYTGTHDNNTTVGWFHQLSPDEQTSVLQYLGCTSPEGIHWDLIRLALSSVADLAIIPLQDILGLGETARMNFPGKAEGNWHWRYRPDALTQSIRSRLTLLTEIFGRAPQDPSHQS